MSLCLIMMTRTLVGNYVNFGVFALYGDPALQEALDMSLKLAVAIPLKDILVIIASVPLNLQDISQAITGALRIFGDSLYQPTRCNCEM